MATFKPGYGTYVAFGVAASEVDYSPILDSLDLGDQVMKLDTTAFGNTAKQYIPGLGETSAKLAGHFSQSEWTTLQAIKAARTISSLIIGPGGHGTGDMKYSNATAFIANMSLKSAVAGIVNGDVEFCVSGTWTLGTF